MWVRILSGNQTGHVVNLPQPEAEQAVATGYARLAMREEWERLPMARAPERAPDAAAPKPKAELEAAREALEAERRAHSDTRDLLARSEESGAGDRAARREAERMLSELTEPEAEPEADPEPEAEEPDEGTAEGAEGAERVESPQAAQILTARNLGAIGWGIFDKSGHKINEGRLTQEEAAAWVESGRDPRSG